MTGSSSDDLPPRPPPAFGEPDPAKPDFGVPDLGAPDFGAPPEQTVEPPAPPKRPRRSLGGWLVRIVAALFVIGVLAPATWVIAYRFVEAPFTLLMVQRAMEGMEVRRTVVPLSEISPHLVRAVIAAEDNTFCAHNGFDWEALRAAQEYNARMEERGSDSRRGASTISQQTAKNLFLWPARSMVRKAVEAYFTMLIEAFWPKERIMEAYLNAAEWGDGVFGAEAAAQAYFGRSAADLTRFQAARLAAVLPNPNRWRADNPGPYVRRRTGQLQARARAVDNEGLAACVLAPREER